MPPRDRAAVRRAHGLMGADRAPEPPHSDGDHHHHEIEIDPPDLGIAVPWIAACQIDRNAEPRPNLYNGMLALRSDRRISDLFAFDEMRCAPVLSRPVPGAILQNGESALLRAVRDEEVSLLQEFLQRAGIEKASKDVVHQAVDLRARERAFHPVRDYLQALVWDGNPRLASWVVDYLGAADSAYHRAMGEMFLVSMVARIFRPGCKCDHMAVL